MKKIPKATTPNTRRADSQQLVRQWTLLRLLSASGQAFGVKQLAEQLGVSKASVQRDVATLERDFALIEEESGLQKKVYRIDQSIRALEGLSLGTTELLAIHAAEAALAGLAGTPLHDDLEAVRLKIRGFLQPASQRRPRCDCPGLRAPRARSRRLRRSGGGDRPAVRRDRTASPVRDHLSRRLEPHDPPTRGAPAAAGLASLRAVLAGLPRRAPADHHARGAPHRALDVGKETFSPPRLDVDAHVRRGFGIFVSDAEEDVEITFAEEIAWRVEERTYDPDERKERRPDGTLRYQVRSSAQ